MNDHAHSLSPQRDRVARAEEGAGRGRHRATVTGLRLDDGDLIMKIEQGVRAVQVRIETARPFTAEDGTQAVPRCRPRPVGADRPLERYLERDRWPVPSAGAGSGGGDNELLKALHGKLAGRKPREIAIAIYGAERIAATAIADCQHDIADLKSDVKLIKWIVGFNLAFTVATVALLVRVFVG